MPASSLAATVASVATIAASASISPPPSSATRTPDPVASTRLAAAPSFTSTPSAIQRHSESVPSGKPSSFMRGVSPTNAVASGAAASSHLKRNHGSKLGRRNTSVARAPRARRPHSATVAPVSRRASCAVSNGSMRRNDFAPKTPATRARSHGRSPGKRSSEPVEPKTQRQRPRAREYRPVSRGIGRSSGRRPSSSSTASVRR